MVQQTRQELDNYPHPTERRDSVQGDAQHLAYSGQPDAMDEHEAEDNQPIMFHEAVDRDSIYAPKGKYQNVQLLPFQFPSGVSENLGAHDKDNTFFKPQPQPNEVAKILYYKKERRVDANPNPKKPKRAI